MTHPTETQERHQSLWLLTVAPTVWAAHFLACYVTAAVWCAKVAGPHGSLTTVRIAIAAFTALALVGIAIPGWLGYRRLHRVEGETPHDEDTPEDRHRFLGFATILLSALSAVATLYVAMAAVFLGDCR